MKILYKGELVKIGAMDFDRWEVVEVEVFTLGQWQWYRANAGDPDEQARLAQAAAKGTLLGDDGKPLPDDAERRVRYRLTHDVPSPEADWLTTRVRGPQRMLIPGLLPWGFKPLISGNPKSGKSKLMAHLAATLLVPGHRFLGHFPPVELTDTEREGGLWLVNAKHPPDQFEDYLIADGVDLDRALVRVVHLELEGGADSFDLTNEAVYEHWANRLVWCLTCDGSDDVFDSLGLLVDDVLAILLAAGKTDDQLGQWLAQYRKLTAAVDIPLGAVSSHATQKGGHAMGGVLAQAVMDGLVTYSSDRPDDPFSPRSISVRATGGGVSIPKTQVEMGDDGRLVMKEIGRPSSRRSAAKPVHGEQESPAKPDPADIKAAILEYVGRCNAAGHGPSVREVRENVSGRNPVKDRALADLVVTGHLVVKDRVGRGGGNSYWLPTVPTVPAPPVPTSQ